jgi:hypothetical protein
MIVGSNILAGASGQAGYFLQRSVRLRSSASANFTRTPSSATNRKTWTWSGWIKRGLLSSNTSVFGAYTSVNAYAGLYFDSSTNVLGYQDRLSGVNNAFLVTTQVFRDPSSWYHIILAIDTTQATASNRLKMYINGVQVTAFSTATYPNLNYDGFVNNNILHEIGSLTGGNYYDGYLEEINFIDGQALTPTSFGEFNVLTGVWQPKKYVGTYGTNGFYLNFEDNSAATAAAIGKDNSGNGNNWTPNNISVTAGVTYDSMTDVPTLTSPTTANYCVGNPLNADGSTWSNANLNFSLPNSTNNAQGTLAVTSGKYYWEVVYTSGAQGTGAQEIGLRTRWTNGVIYSPDGSKYVNGTNSAYGATYTTGDVIGVALDMTGGTVTFYKNNTSQGAISISGSGMINATFSLSAGGGVTSVGSVNFGQRPFSYTPPTGFVAFNTFNLPDSTISNGATQMAASLYTGNGVAAPNALSVTNTVNGISFKPDFVWIKSRSLAQSNILQDAVRGLSVFVESNTTTGDQATGGGDVSSFDSNGFTISYGNGRTNQNGATYVGWQWKASNAAAVTNTSGTISSQVSANSTAGFSVVTYTGTGTNGATFGHGLGVAPAFGIWKVRTGTIGNWVIYHQSLGATRGLNFTTGAATTSAVFFNNTAPTSTVWSLGTVTDVNRSTSTYVNYAFSEIAGYSKFGSYTGNGSADGVFVYLGFRPRWLLIKRTDSTGGWNLYDSTRNPYNVADLILQPNNSNAEASGITFPSAIDFLSNGFKTRNYDATYGPNINANGGTYIYAAFAENPTKFALAR